MNRPQQKDKELPLDAEYMNKIKDLALSIQKWMKANPKLSPKIQFNYPKGVMFIAAITDAMNVGAVTANDDGKKLIADIMDINPRKEETAFMFQMAMEHMEQIIQEEQ